MLTLKGDTRFCRGKDSSSARASIAASSSEYSARCPVSALAGLGRPRSGVAGLLTVRYGPKSLVASIGTFASAEVQVLSDCQAARVLQIDPSPFRNMKDISAFFPLNAGGSQTLEGKERMARSATYDAGHSQLSWMRRVEWADVLLTAAAAAGLYVSIRNYFDRLSGIQGEPGTLLVIVACGLLLFGLAVTVTTTSRGVLVTFQWLILLGAVLTALAGWFLMSWTLTVAMVVATGAQILRIALPELTGIRRAARA
ncbi:hypothetical protein KTN05_15395 [Paracoccus sp. Z118]|nr:hypothetical protein [Paracoccus sp. Z118]